MQDCARTIAALTLNLTTTLESLDSCQLSLNSTEGAVEADLQSYLSLRLKFIGAGAAFAAEHLARLLWMSCKRKGHFPLDA